MTRPSQRRWNTLFTGSPQPQRMKTDETANKGASRADPEEEDSAETEEHPFTDRLYPVHYFHIS